MGGYRPRRSVASSFLSVASVALLFYAVAVGLLAPGCREETVLPIDRNLAPETVLTSAPGDSQTTFYRVRLFWHGTDADGEISGFEWAVTESLPDIQAIEYRFTERTDSTFNFQVESNREVLGHRFYVRAIDNEGKRDPSPAYTFFAARNNCVPLAKFTTAVGIGPLGERRPITSTDLRTPTDTIPAGWSVRFGWTGEDCDVAVNEDGGIDSVGHVVSFSYHLAPLQLNDIFSSLSDTTASYDASRLRSAIYTMFVRAVDDAGFAGLDPAVRTFVWNRDPITRFRRVLLDGAIDSTRGYLADTTEFKPGDYVAIADGDTLPIIPGGVSVQAVVDAIDPDAPDGSGRVATVQARLVRDSAQWQDLGLEERQFDQSGVNSGDYYLMARSIDGYGRNDGTPDTLRVHVNHGVRFTVEQDIDEFTHFVQRPRPGEVIRRTGGPSDTLQIRILAVDPDPLLSAGDLTIQYRWRFLEFPQSDGSVGTESLPHSWRNGLSTGPYFIFYACAHIGADPTDANTECSLEYPILLPGHYVIEIEARDNVVAGSGEVANVGSRLMRKQIAFTIVDR